jgi:D-arabinitol 4-dehydrogenase
MLGSDAFVTSPRLWGDLPSKFPIFAETLRTEIAELEAKWPV